MAYRFLSSHIWVVLACWAIVYISDYYLTLLAARGRRGWLKDHIVLEGSYELTPVFQADIDALRVFSPAFLVRLAVSILAITFVWGGAMLLGLPQIYALLVGGLFLREAVVHLRHLRNLAQIWLTRHGEGLSGQIVYTRWLNYQISAIELGGFCILFLILSLVLGSWEFAGGSLACGMTAVQHWRLATKQPRQPSRNDYSDASSG